LEMEEYIVEIAHLINSVDLVVWHNIVFDNSMIKYEIQRAKLKWIAVDFEPKNILDTMYSSIEYCKLKNKVWDIKYKRPKLRELYKKLFWINFTWMHDAVFDVKATTKCFVELSNRWVINPYSNIERLSLF
jgi:DNA polymerase-3 subunit alpha